MRPSAIDSRIARRLQVECAETKLRKQKRTERLYYFRGTDSCTAIPAEENAMTQTYEHLVLLPLRKDDPGPGDDHDDPGPGGE